MVSEALITHVTNRGKARAMSAIDVYLSVNVTNWSIMADFKILKYCYLKYCEIDQDSVKLQLQDTAFQITKFLVYRGRPP